MIITIDGPAGAGKSTAARELARRLNFRFLDTGAMYRAVAYVALEKGIDLAHAGAVAELAESMDLQWEQGRLLVGGRDITTDVRDPRVTEVVRHAADNVSVRKVLVRLQRKIATGGDFVSEGRDQGTIVFPDAACKFFLTASPESRARRRWKDLTERGVQTTLEEVLKQQIARDEQDSSRAVGRLVAAADAIRVDTDAMSPTQVADRLEQLARGRLALAALGSTRIDPAGRDT